jgi:hypothetical protein
LVLETGFALEGERIAGRTAAILGFCHDKRVVSLTEPFDPNGTFRARRAARLMTALAALLLVGRDGTGPAKRRRDLINLRQNTHYPIINFCGISSSPTRLHHRKYSRH